jgi:5-methylcytosine-specific restriction endonuclease McrA
MSITYLKNSKRSIYEFLKERDGLICGICGESLLENWQKYQLWLANSSSIKRRQCNITIDHIIPKSLLRMKEGFTPTRGWSLKDKDNLQLAHFDCNNKKGNKIIERHVA